MGKLQPDYITWTLSLNAGGLQKEILKTKNYSKELREENKILKESMKELTLQGKYQGEEYQKLDKQLKANNRTISENNDKIRQCENQISNVNKSYAQLSKQAKKLQTELDNTVKSLQPEEYARLEAELEKTKMAMERLKPKTEAVKESFFSLTKMKAVIIGFFAGIGSLVSNFFINAISDAKEWIAESVQIAASADGVQRAFNRMNTPGLLDNLRKSTKNTVNDLQLMKAAVQAKDFRIPLEDLGKYLQFAQLKAQQTGQSVDYMTNSIVTGLGRKSLLILDNLGLSAAEINEEMSKTGDFMGAVANIVDKQLTEAGENYISAADRAAQATVDFQNQQLKLGEILLPIKEKWDAVYGSFQIGLLKVVGWIAQHRASLVTLVTAISTYITVQKLSAVWNAKYASSTIVAVAAEKLHAIQLNLSRKAFLAKLIVLDLYRGRCNLATAATEMFNIVLKASPLGIITTLVATAATALYMFGNKTSVANKSIGDFTQNLMVQKTSLNNIFDELKKTNPKTEERTKLVKQLNETYPDLIRNYNLETAQLQEITRAQNEANAALTNRIATEMKSKAVGDFIGNNISKQLDIVEYLLGEAYSQMGDGVYSKLQSGLKSFLNDSSKDLQDFWGTFGKYFHSTLANDDLTSFRDAFFTLRKEQKNLSLGIVEINQKYEPYIKSIKTVVELSDEEIKKQMEITSKIKELEKERQHVQDTWMESNDEEITKKNKELERLDNLIKKKKEQGTTKAALGETNVRDKKKEKEKKDLLDSEKKQIQELENLREKDLQKQKTTYDSSMNAYRLMLHNKTISQEQFEIYTAAVTLNNAEAIQTIEEKYSQKSVDLVLVNGELKAKAVEDAGVRVAKAEQDTFDARLKAETAYYNNLQAMKGMLQEATDDPVARLDAEYKAQLAILDGLRKASLDYARKNGQDETEIEKTYTNAKKALYKNYCKDKINISNQTKKKLAGIVGNELSEDIANVFNAVSNLKDIFKNFSDPDFWNNFKDNILENMSMLVNSVTSGLSSAFRTFEQIEKDNVDAKYDAEIAAAAGNSEEIEKLEEEKAQKKLDIEKKYADVQFAIKASEIVANTALAIIMALGQLGPIAGPIAAALMGATGAVQLAAANAERQKVKNMTLNNSSSSSSGSAERVINGSSGYSEGGFTGEGGRYEIAGAVHRGEYVIPVPEMKNKRVFNMVKVIESIRRQRTVSNPLPGYSEGGHVTDRNNVDRPDYSIFEKAAERLENAADKLSKPSRNYVLLSDINEAEEIKYKAEKPFTRGDN